MAGDSQAKHGSGSSEWFTDVACTVCGCVCDDLKIEVADDKIISKFNSCRLADEYYGKITDCRTEVPRIEGQATTFENAIARGVELLRGSLAPLIYGLSRSSTPGQRAATELADRLGANIDTTASRCHAPSIMAIQEVGESTCTLGEVKNRCDLVIYWGADPEISHPRHWSRYAVDPKGMLIPNGRDSRYVVVVGAQPNKTSERADLAIDVPKFDDFDWLWTMRELVRRVGPKIRENDLASLRKLLANELDALKRLVGDKASSSLRRFTQQHCQQMVELVARMLTAHSGVVFFGIGLTDGDTGHITVEALLKLVSDLNRYVRFYARRLRIPGDVAGADSVLCWQTGFPFSVNLARGYPRYNPGEYSANELLSRREVDCCLVVGSESIARLSDEAKQALAELPTIVLDYAHVQPTWEPTVWIPTAIYGVEAKGTAYRMDETPIPLRPFLKKSLSSDEEILAAIMERLTL